MEFSLKHSKNVGLEKLGKDTYGSGWAARTLNADRIMKDHENDKWNLGQLMDMESILMLKEGKGDAWIAIREKDHGKHYDSTTWMAVGETVTECMALITALIIEGSDQRLTYQN